METKAKSRFVDEYDEIIWSKAIPALIFVLFIVVTILSTFKIVPTGHTGVRITFGQVQEDAVQQGINLKVPYIQRIRLVNNQQQDLKLKDVVWGETSERTVVFAEDIIVTYQISSARSVWLYKNVRGYSNGHDLITPDIVSSSVKSAMVQLATKDVTNRSRIEPLAKDSLNQALGEKYGAGTISILKVVINQMDFEDSYNDAIAKKQIAQQEYEKAQIENTTAIERAEAAAKQKEITATANAKATLLEAEAQAKANEVLNQSINNSLIEYEKIRKWDGELPTVTGSDAIVKID